MAKFNLNIGDNLRESLLFWLTRYLTYKAITLNNSKADKEALQLALDKTRPTPQSFEALVKIAREVNKAGVGVYTLFYPTWLWSKENANSPDFTSLKDIDEEALMQWLSIATSSKSEATKKTYRTALQDFFNYISKHNEDKYYFDIDLSKWQRNIKNALQKPPAFLTDEEVEKFLNNLDNFVVNIPRKDEINKNTTALYRFMFKLALASGLRVSELVNLKTKEFEINSKEDIVTIRVLNSKGNKSRIVVVPYSIGKLAIKKEFNEYLKLRSCQKECKEYIFCSNKGKCLHRYTPDKVLKQYLLQLGIKKEKMGMHLLRHTHATYFYSRTKDPVLLQERLGHSDPQTTRRYIHLEDEKVRKSVEAMR